MRQPIQYETLIGLEVHAQLQTKSKIFCNCSTKFGASPNTHTCPVCLGMPGTLPVLNRTAINYTLSAALATNCRINQYSIWTRKNYFYPDLPKNYQISMYELPIAEHGWVNIEIKDTVKRINITRIHLEEDAGKLTHNHKQSLSYIDYNRAGIPLIEIVSEPNIHTSEEAVIYLKTLRNILTYLTICDGNLEKGSFRCDVNISVRPLNQTNLGTRTEIKNINSFHFVAQALEYEIYRQCNILNNGGNIIQETRLWDTNTNITKPMRNKEKAHDYRYFPDPDLLPLVIDKKWITNIKTNYQNYQYINVLVL